MPLLKIASSRCTHCDWRGQVRRGDCRLSPLRRNDGSIFRFELICPRCGQQVINPFNADEVLGTITPQRERHYQQMARNNHRSTIVSLLPYWLRKLLGTN